MKKLMILGAGIYQVPLIKKAREMGLFTIVVSYPGPYPGFALGDECLYLDTTDGSAVLDAARKLGIDGICTTGTDVAVSTIGLVAESLGLRGIPHEAALLATDKLRMKEAFQKNGVTSAPFLKVSSFEEAKDAFLKLSKPVMVKAVDSSGSRGVSKVSTLSELSGAYQASAEVSRQPYVILEEFVDGTEIGVDGFVENGSVVLLLPHQKFVLTSGATSLPAGHSFPYPASERVLASIGHEIRKAVSALCLDNCAFNADVMICGETPFLLEMGGRAGATGIPELVSLYCGFDFYQKMIENALGETPDFACGNPKPCMSRLLFSPVDGTITRIDSSVIRKLRNEGADFSLDYGEGDPVSKVRNGTDRIGQVILPSSSEPEMNALMKRLYAAVFVDGISLWERWEVCHETV